MPVTTIIGTQWGDEGKGKCVDAAAADADAVVRFQGGNNAGHTLVVDGEKTVLHLIPSGALYDGVDCYLARGTVLNPETFLEEVEALRDRGVDMAGRLFVSQNTPLIMPWHIEMDAARESGEGAIGTTKKGIGPTYEQFVARQAILAGDLRRPDDAIAKIEMFYGERLASLRANWNGEGDPPFATVDQAVERFRRRHEQVYTRLVPFISDVETELRERIRAGDHIVMEGAQGTYLDVGMGTYPFVTSSHTTAAGACTGAGVAPRAIDRVIGVCKAYTTRVGDGPFPTELPVDSGVGRHLQDVGNEYGATTGRPRRCGWLDLPMLTEAVDINGCDEVVITKLDVLSGLDEIKLAVDHTDGEPVYETFEGWQNDITDVRDTEELPENARRYLEFIAQRLAPFDCTIGQVSVGPGRRQIFEY